MRKIVYLVEQPLDERNYDRFGLDSWIAKGWNVEVWDITPLAYPRVWKDFLESSRQQKKYKYYFPITSRIEVEERLAGFEQGGYFIDITGENSESTRIKVRLVKKKGTRIICPVGTTPEVEDYRNQKLGRKLARVLHRARNPASFPAYLRSAIVRHIWAPFIEPRIVVVSGRKSISANSGRQELIRAHNLDYDIYLKLVQHREPVSKGYGVFIDQNYCFHPDFIFQGIPFYATPEKYFPAVARCLRSISRDCGIEMQIAGHPVSSRAGQADYFGGIPICYGKTAELIRDCEFAICHNSTAIQFAVLFNKPLIFLTTDELERSPAGKSIAVFASELGKTVINIDRDVLSVNWRDELHVDFGKYQKYRENYIKCTGSPEIPHWEIVIGYLEGRKQNSARASKHSA